MTGRGAATRTFKALLAAAALCWVAVAGAQIPVPALTGRIVDQTGTLSPAQQAPLEQTLATFEARKGTQIAVLIVPTTAPEAIEQFSIRVADKWKLGRKKVDDGAILIVAKDDRTTRIEVGYGLEGVLTDLTSHRIIDEVVLPRFRSDDFYGGITAGVDRIIRVVDGQSARERAIGVFSQLRVWDTQHNNGLLIYVLLADRAVEIVADRGIYEKVSSGEWNQVCRQMEAAFKQSNYEGGVVAGVRAVTRHLAAHFPANGEGENELPDAPVVLR